ncbi:MAG: Gfo/Idh/MocA family oxidoreductase [Bacteroidota bacterium]
MYKLGILGTARIAPKAVITPAAIMNNIHIYGIASRNPANAQQFATDHKIPMVYDAYEKLIGDPEVDIIYIPLPNSLHTHYCLKAVQAGKHVLCEKPISMNAEEARQLQKASKPYAGIIMEGFHYRYHPVFTQVQKWIKEGVIGEVREMESVFTVPPRPEGDIRFQYQMGGGSLMDLGCYCVHILRQLMEMEPEVNEATTVSPDGLIDWAMETQLAFGETISARVHCSFEKHAVYRSDLRITGTKGEIEVPNPFSPQKNEGGTHLMLTRNGHKETHVVTGETTFFYQLNALVKAIEDDTYVLPTGLDDAIKNMEALDRIYLASGLPVRKK